MCLQVGHDAAEIDEWFAKVAQRLHNALTFLGGAGVHGYKQDKGTAVDVFRENLGVRRNDAGGGQ